MPTTRSRLNFLLFVLSLTAQESNTFVSRNSGTNYQKVIPLSKENRLNLSFKIKTRSIESIILVIYGYCAGPERRARNLLRPVESMHFPDLMRYYTETGDKRGTIFTDFI